MGRKVMGAVSGTHQPVSATQATTTTGVAGAGLPLGTSAGTGSTQYTEKTTTTTSSSGGGLLSGGRNVL